MAVDLGKILKESGAILEGHFLLSSGRHSAVYFEKFRVLEEPKVLSALCDIIAHHYRRSGFDYVAGPLTGGIIIAFEVARHLGIPARYIENEDGKKTFRRNATLEPGARVLVVDDVLTTGLSLNESADAVRAAGGQVASYAVLIDRSETFTPDAPFFAAYKVQSPTYAADELPDWLNSIPITKPGTRKV